MNHLEESEKKLEEGGKEFITCPQTAALSGFPLHYVSIMNLRGQIISIIDLRLKLKIKSDTENLEEAVIIMEHEGVSAEVIVDSTNKVINLDSTNVSKLPRMNSKINAKYIQGVYKNDDRLTVLIDLKEILNINEIKQIQKKAAKIIRRKQ